MDFRRGRKAGNGDADVAVYFEPNVARIEARRGEFIDEARVRIDGVQAWRPDTKEMVRRALERRGMLHVFNYRRIDPLSLSFLQDGPT